MHLAVPSRNCAALKLRADIYHFANAVCCAAETYFTPQKSVTDSGT
jgi:hypothetical protein